MSEYENNEGAMPLKDTKGVMTLTKYIIHLFKKYWWLYVLWWILKLTVLGGVTQWFLTNMGYNIG